MLRVPGLLVALAMGGLVVGCSTSADFDDRSLDDLEAGLDDRGVTVCDEATADVDLPGATATTTYVLAFDCDSDDDAFLVATEYDNRDDRDASASQFEVRQVQGVGAVWTHGQYTIVLSGPRDDDVVDAVAETLDDLGAY